MRTRRRLRKAALILSPRAVLTPGSEVMVDGLPGREVVRKQTPLAATTRDVEDAPKAPGRPRLHPLREILDAREMGLYEGPLGIG